MGPNPQPTPPPHPPPTPTPLAFLGLQETTELNLKEPKHMPTLRNPAGEKSVHLQLFVFI